MKKVKSVLSKWRKSTFGDIFKKIATLEDMVKSKEIQLEICPSEENIMALNKMDADLKRYLHMEEEYWKKKVDMRLFKDGDRNTKFFQCYVKGRRRKMTVSEIQTMQGDVVSSTQNIGEEVAVNFYMEQFTQEQEGTNFDMLQCIPKQIRQEQNDHSVRLPSIEEVKKVVFALNGESASSPGGFSGQFFQSCWEIIGEDVTNTV